ARTIGMACSRRPRPPPRCWQNCTTPWLPRSMRRMCARSWCNPGPFPRPRRARNLASYWPTSSPVGAAWCGRRTFGRIERTRTRCACAARRRRTENAMRNRLALLLTLVAAMAPRATSAETLKVAVAQRGFWNSTFIDVGLKQGYFREAGLDIEILYTEGGASTLTPVIAGSIDIAMTNGILGVVAAYAKGMPVKIIS